MKPYFQLDRVIEAAFYGAQKLFGLTFHPVDVPVWHPDVRSWEVRGPDGSHVGIFYGDYFARPSKQGGAWMSTLRDQEKLTGNVRPIVLNVMNFNKGDPTLLSFEDARTLFHEFGHGLHGLLSNVTYPTVSCTSVLTDWVELPSQLYEHWFEQPEVLRKFARHYKTGEPIPEALVQKLHGGEELRPRLPDRGIHLVGAGRSRPALCCRRPTNFDVNAFESETLERIGMPEEIAMRHRPPHFTHVFSGGYYASAYYSYMWSEVLDADAFAAFEETGDIFNPEVAKKLRDNVLSAGGSRDPAELYVAFRGRLPNADALLKKRGFARRHRSGMIDLHTAGHRRGVVCAPHAAAAEAGRDILGEGGNALEAMVAMAASIAAVYPHMNHIGGDGFWLVREPNKRVRAIMAAGPAGAHAEPALYREHETIPSRGPLAALTVPGAVGGWMLAVEAARAVGGKGLPLDAAAARGDRPGARRLCRDQEPGAADHRKACRAEECAGLRRDVPAGRQAAGGGREAQAGARWPSRSIIWRAPASTISIAAMSGARSPPTWKRSAAR